MATTFCGPWHCETSQSATIETEEDKAIRVEQEALEKEAAKQARAEKRLLAQENAEKELARRRADPAYQLAEWLNGVNGLIFTVKNSADAAARSSLPHGFGQTYATIFNTHEEELKKLREELETKHPKDSNLPARLKVASTLVEKVEQDVNSFTLIHVGTPSVPSSKSSSSKARKVLGKAGQATGTGAPGTPKAAPGKAALTKAAPQA